MLGKALSPQVLGLSSCMSEGKWLLVHIKDFQHTLKTKP
jgi:hypothetical protein